MSFSFSIISAQQLANLQISKDSFSWDPYQQRSKVTLISQMITMTYTTSTKISLNTCQGEKNLAFPL